MVVPSRSVKNMPQQSSPPRSPQNQRHNNSGRPDHRQDRDHRQNNPRFEQRNNNQGGHNRPKPNRQREPQKPQNPIWEQAAELTQQKSLEQKKKITDVVNKFIDSTVTQVALPPAPRQPELPAPSDQQPEKKPTVLKAGEVLKF